MTDGRERREYAGRKKSAGREECEVENRKASVGTNRICGMDES